MKMTLQRKCDGGGCGCDDCDRRKLQREATGPASERVPSIVHDVLRSPGEPLDRPTRRQMESRFGHDFSRVRVHRGERAAASAAAVGARGYTVGADVVLGRGAGPHTLAHELAHTIQQEGATRTGPLEIGRADDPLERAADGMAQGRSGVVLRRDADPPPKKTEAAPATEQHAGQPLTDPELTKAGDAVGGAVQNFDPEKEKAKDPKRPAIRLDDKTVEREQQSAPGGATTFILHDTSSSVGAAGIKAQLKENRGPLGKGVNAYVPRTDPAAITRPFFDAYRPTTTEGEKNLDFFKQPGDKATGGPLLDLLTKRRNAAFRSIWALVDPVFYPTIFPAILSLFDLTQAEIKIETEGKDTVKDKKKVHEPGAIEQLTDPKVEKIYTSATWGVELIATLCRLEMFAEIFARKGKAADLKAAADALYPYFSGRNAIIGSTVTAEIVQPGVTKEAEKKGFKNSCAANNAQVVPFQSPSYSENQYDNVHLLYLRAAVMAKHFPFVTTHKLVDEKYGGHCDPRCFNLGHLYDKIATTVGHKVGTSLYGAEPTYGNQPGKSVWWDDFSKSNHVCAEAPPK